VRLRVQQPALVELAMHLDQKVADLAQERRAHRRVVDEGSAAAVGGDHPAQDQLALERDAVVVEQGSQRRRIGRLELGDDRALLRPDAD
jgi:hypothetical protein